MKVWDSRVCDFCRTSLFGLASLKLIGIAPENGWLEDDPFLLGFGLFSGGELLNFRAVNIRSLECFVSETNILFDRVCFSLKKMRKRGTDLAILEIYIIYHVVYIQSIIV